MFLLLLILAPWDFLVRAGVFVVVAECLLSRTRPVNWRRITLINYFCGVFSRRTNGNIWSPQFNLAYVRVSCYAAFIWCEVIAISQVVVKNLQNTLIGNLQRTSMTLTAHRDRPGLVRVAHYRRLTNRSPRKSEQQQYILPKEEKVVAGVTEKVLEHVREHVQSDMPQLLQLLPLKRTGLWQHAHMLYKRTVFYNL